MNKMREEGHNPLCKMNRSFIVGGHGMVPGCFVCRHNG